MTPSPAHTAPPPAAVAAARTPWPTLIWVLLIGTFLIRSAGFIYPFLAYHLADRGVEGTWASIVLALFGAGWLTGQVVCGAAADRLGRRATLVGAMTGATGVFAVLAQTHGLAALAVSAFLAGVCYDAPRPIVSALIADSVPDEPTRARIAGWRYFAVNLGAACTGAVGGLLTEAVGTTPLFLTNAAACALFAAAAWRFLPARTSTPPPVSGTYRAAFTDVRLMLLWLVSVCALIPVAALYSVLPVMMAQDHLPASAYGFSQVAGAIAVLILSPLLNPYLARRATGNRPMVGLLAVSAVILGAGMGSAGLTSHPAGYAAAVIAAVPGEIVAFVAASNVVNLIAPAHSRGLYAGVWSSTLAVAVIGAPLLASWALSTGAHPFVALVLMACGLTGAVICLPLSVLVHRPRPPATAPPLPQLVAAAQKIG
ncbi:MFS transporter [Streptomyces sp. BH-SS-21]|uniref:MFS transporter n=1 Tax=Streptomyces liliiviolaceus TaxID=2823109 RepID=A0A941B7D7_9ACTN|nr:MFS transporter [Streptomyces liliiviolaceus]MBQ0850361.1 MFS transporter [Streptomyces liliiviolaceus]